MRRFAPVAECGLVVASLGREVDVCLGGVLPVADSGEVCEVVANVVVDVGRDICAKCRRGDVRNVCARKRWRGGDGDGIDDCIVGMTVVDDYRLGVVNREQVVAVDGLFGRASIDEDDQRQLLAVAVACSSIEVTSSVAVSMP